MPFVVANYVYASSQGQRTHSARTNNGHFVALAHALRAEQQVFFTPRMMEVCWSELIGDINTTDSIIARKYAS